MKTVCLNGRFLEEDKAFVSINDAGFLYGEGIYETLRTVHGEILNLSGHLARLKRSADYVGIPLPSRTTLERWLQGTVKRAQTFYTHHALRIRLTVSGGLHDFDADPKKPTVLITVRPLEEVHEEQRMHGLTGVTYSIERPFPVAKTTNMVPTLMARRYMRKKKAYEVLFVDHRGYVTEGSVSNVFLVQNGRLVTPKFFLLAGTTRERIFKLAPKMGWKIHEKDVLLEELYAAEEVFICNAPRGVVPMVEMDGRMIGNGKVGKWSLDVWEALKKESRGD
jgi:branched-subunit amino acid aminotransferase/4-amino-4-deoxychorismate lyase